MLNCNLTEMYCAKAVNQIITGNETLTTTIMSLWLIMFGKSDKARTPLKMTFVQYNRD